MQNKFVLIISVLIFSLTPAAADGGKLKVSSNAQGKVYLNDIYVGETGSTISNLPAGEVRLKVKAEGMESVEKKITIWGGGTAEFVATLKKKGEGESTLEEKGKSEPESKKIESRPKATEQNSGNKAEEKDEDEDAASKPVSEEEVEKASKAKDNARLAEILNGKSDYVIRLMAAAALIRLKDEAGTDWLDAQEADSFRQAGKDFFEKSPLVEDYRALENERLAMVIKTKEAKIDTFEEAVAAYRLILELEKRRQEVVIEKNEREENWDGRRGGRRGFRRANREKDIKEDLEKEEKLNRDLMKAVTALLKKATISKNKDLGALAKQLLKYADERINPEK